jgi:hypothetical protein
MEPIPPAAPQHAGGRLISRFVRGLQHPAYENCSTGAFLLSLEDEHVNGLLRFLGNQTTCMWCKHPRERVLSRSGLCSHCNRLRKKLEKAESEVANFQHQHGSIPPLLDREVRIRRFMVENAKAEGDIYGQIHVDHVTGLDLEHELDLLSKRYVHKEFFHGDASSLDSNLCLNHRRYLRYILSLLNREYMRQNRRGLAREKLLDEAIESPQKWKS